MGARGIGHIAQLCETAAPDGWRDHHRGVGPQRVVRFDRGGGPGQGELIEALPSDGVAVSTPTTPTCCRSSTGARPRFSPSAPSRPPTSRVSEVKLDRHLHPTFQLDHNNEIRRSRFRWPAPTWRSTPPPRSPPPCCRCPVRPGRRPGCRAVELSPWRMEVSTTPEGVLWSTTPTTPTRPRCGRRWPHSCETGAADLIAVIGEMPSGRRGPR